jgi:hypothetical protein
MRIAPSMTRPVSPRTAAICGSTKTWKNEAGTTTSFVPCRRQREAARDLQGDPEPSSSPDARELVLEIRGSLVSIRELGRRRRELADPEEDYVDSGAQEGPRVLVSMLAVEGLGVARVSLPEGPLGGADQEVVHDSRGRQLGDRGAAQARRHQSEVRPAEVERHRKKHRHLNSRGKEARFAKGSVNCVACDLPIRF